MTGTPDLKKYIITWVEDREVVAVGTSENEALLNATTMTGRWIKRDQYKAKEA